MEWAAYYKTPADKRDNIRDVIPFEVSNTKLADLIIPPRLVRELDWVENFWPKGSKGKTHKYPKAQLYCLMNVQNAWTASTHLTYISVR